MTRLRARPRWQTLALAASSALIGGALLWATPATRAAASSQGDAAGEEPTLCSRVFADMNEPGHMPNTFEELGVADGGVPATLFDRLHIGSVTCHEDGLAGQIDAIVVTVSDRSTSREAGSLVLLGADEDPERWSRHFAALNPGSGLAAYGSIFRLALPGEEAAFPPDRGERRRMWDELRAELREKDAR